MLVMNNKTRYICILLPIILVLFVAAYQLVKTRTVHRLDYNYYTLVPNYEAVKADWRKGEVACASPEGLLQLSVGQPVSQNMVKRPYRDWGENGLEIAWGTTYLYVKDGTLVGVYSEDGNLMTTPLTTQTIVR
jgi:hypothetical protein